LTDTGSVSAILVITSLLSAGGVVVGGVAAPNGDATHDLVL
jgi:hypothetical protein